MTTFELDSICEALLATFPGKSIPKATKDRTYQRVKDVVPGKLTKAIIERIEDTRDTMPGNLGKAILDAWRALDTGVDNEKPRDVCPYCDGDGAITCYRKDSRTGEIKTSVVFCAHCRPTSEPRATREQLRAAGFMVCPSADRAEQTKWTRALIKHNAAVSQARQQGNLRPGDLLSNFDAMLQATSEAKRPQPDLYGEQRL